MDVDPMYWCGIVLPPPALIPSMSGVLSGVVADAARALRETLTPPYLFYTLPDKKTAESVEAGTSLKRLVFHPVGRGCDKCSSAY